MKNNSIRTVVATGIGAALFIIIGMFVNIPILGTLASNFSMLFKHYSQLFLGLLQVSLWALLACA